MITKPGIFLAVITVLITILAVSMRDVNFYIFSSLGYSILLVSYFTSLARIKKLTASRSLPKAVFAQQHLYVRINLRTTSIFQEGPFRITDFFTPAHSIESRRNVFIAYLDKETPMRYSYDAMCQKRGVYNVGPVIIEAADFLGVFKIRRQIDIYTELIIYPLPFNVFYLPIKRGVPSFGGEASRVAGDYEEFYGIREYKIDDGLRKIHWPSTARLGELMVKQYEQGATYKTTIILDLHQARQANWGTGDSFEWSVRISASIAKYLIDRKMHLQFIAEGMNSYVSLLRQGEPQLFEVLDLLARVNADGLIELENVLDIYEQFIPSGSCLILVFSKASQYIFERLARLAMKRVSIIAIVLKDSDSEAEFVITPDGDKINFYDMLTDLCSSVYVVNESDVVDIEKKFAFM